MKKFRWIQVTGIFEWVKFNAHTDTIVDLADSDSFIQFYLVLDEAWIWSGENRLFNHIF